MSPSWPKVRLGEVLRPASRAEPVDASKEYRLVGVRLDGRGPFLREIVSGAETSAKILYRIASGDFIYSRLFACRGAFGVIAPELDGCFVSGEFPTFLPVEEKLDAHFLRHWFRLSDTLDRVNEDCAGSTPLTRNRFKEQFFLGLEIPLPPLAEQQRIVARIEELAVKIAEARSLRKQAIEDAVALLRSVASTIFARLPIRGTLAAILLDKPRNGWSAKCDNSESGVPVLTLSAVTGFRYKGTAFKRTSESVDPAAHYWLRSGDLLITRSNTPELVGHAAIYDGSPAPCIYPDLMMRLGVNQKVADPSFVWLWLQTGQVREYIGITRKAPAPR